MSLAAAEFDAIKLQVGSLRKGMFVCGLDCPWEKTSFPHTGFEIKTDRDLELLKNYCNYVSVDLARTFVEHVKLENNTSPHKAPPEHPFASDKQHSLLQSEMPVAEEVKNDTVSLVNSMVDSLRSGHSLDIQLGRYAVSECVASILRNPDAMVLVSQIQQQNQHFADHAFLVCIHSIALGKRNGLRAKQLEELGLCGLLHDVGNLKIPDFIINKTGSLDEEENRFVKQHARYGRDILLSSRTISQAAADVAYTHHECLDGSGYPRGISAPDIDLNTRIVGVVDKYAAITQHSVYKSAQTHLDAINLLHTLADNGKIDKRLRASFIASLGIYPPGTLVGLSSNEIAIVLKTSAKHWLRPQLLIVRDEHGIPVEKRIDLATTLVDSRGREYKIRRAYLPGYQGIDLLHYQNALMQAYDD